MVERGVIVFAISTREHHHAQASAIDRSHYSHDRVAPTNLVCVFLTFRALYA
jgi:hypothetical protein